MISEQKLIEYKDVAMSNENRLFEYLKTLDSKDNEVAGKCFGRETLEIIEEFNWKLYKPIEGDSFNDSSDFTIVGDGRVFEISFSYEDEDKKSRNEKPHESYGSFSTSRAFILSKLGILPDEISDYTLKPETLYGPEEILDGTAYLRKVLKFYEKLSKHVRVNISSSGSTLEETLRKYKLYKRFAARHGNIYVN